MVRSMSASLDAVLIGSKLARVIPLLIVIVVLAAMVSLYAGYKQMWLSDIWLDSKTRAIFLHLRLPRVLMAAMIGASLAIVGAALQSLFRNALADPFTLGVSGGASLGASLALALGLGLSVAGVPAVFVLAFAGAGLAMLAVYYLARAGRVVMPGTLLLAGIVMNLCASAGVLLLQYLTDYSRALQILRWMIGNLDVVGYGILWRAMLFLVPGWLVLFRYARELNLIAMGEQSASTLGVDVARVRRRVYIAASLIIGVTASVGGSIGFVGLIVPHSARLIFGQDLRLLLPASFLLGAAFLMLADAAARSLLSPSELPVGVLTALMGGPFFLWLLRRERRLAAF
jgi:iron complex transport system permease protein